MRELNSERVTLGVGIAEMLSLLRCCGLPLLVAAFGLAASRTVSNGASRASRWWDYPQLACTCCVGRPAAATADTGANSPSFHCDCELTLPHLQDSDTAIRPRRGP